MAVDLGLFASAFMTMVVIVDPAGNLPVFMSLTARMTEPERRKVALQANLIALGILLLFGFFGFIVFDWMHISAEALQISGGILLLIVALQLLTGVEQQPNRDHGSLSVAAVPLGMPLLAGPGGIVAFMLLVQDAMGNWVDVVTVVVALVAVMLISWLAMHFATPIMRLLGNSGVQLLTKLSGMLLAAIAMQLIITGGTTVLRAV